MCVWTTAAWQTCMPPGCMWGWVCVCVCVGPQRDRLAQLWGIMGGLATDGCEHPGMQDAASTAFLKNCLCHPVSTTLLSAGWDLLGRVLLCCWEYVGAIKHACSCCIVRLFSVASAWLVPCSLLSCWLVSLSH